MSADLSALHPGTYKRLLAMSVEADEALARAGLDPLLGELVKIRVSQLNGCAHCLRMHTRDAIAKGEAADRLAVLPAWWESQYFSDAEQSALALAEQITAIAAPPRHSGAAGSLTPEQVSAVSWLAIVMNSWNRVAIASHYPVGSDDAR